MKPRQLLPPCSLLTQEDLNIWVCLKWDRHTFSQADRCDADLMLVLAEVKPCLPRTKAVAHRMVAGQLAESVNINGLWVALA